MQDSVSSSQNSLNTKYYKKSFLQGIQNARYLLEKLNRSIQKTSVYEARLLQCKATHAHSHHTNERRDRGQLELFNAKESISKTEKSTASTSRSPIDLAASWSTMSIVCLQYQYEELSKRYESLLKAYDERCTVLNARETSVQHLRERVKAAQEQLTCSHEALLSVGEKYLTLRYKMLSQKCWYEDKVQRLLETLRRILSETERIRLELDEQLSQCLAGENDAVVALLLAEIKKCNLLSLNNITLKVEIEELLSKQ